jgi:hypothetical protein
MFATPSLASAVELWHCVGWRCEEGGRGGGTNLGSCVGDIKHGCVQEAAPPVSLSGAYGLPTWWAASTRGN